jgi:DNA-binding CsgD family transcriptional regulator
MHGRGPSNGFTSFLNAGLDGLDAASRRRVELRASEAALAAGAGGWALGLFDTERDLIAFATSSSQIDIRNALALLCMVPLPQSSGPVELKATPQDGDAGALGTAVEFGESSSLAIVFVHPRLDEATRWTAVDAIEGCAAALAQELAGLANHREKFDSANGPAAEPHAFFLLTQALDVKMAWNADDKASQSLAEVVEPSGERLPLFLERPIRRLIASWNFSAIAGCKPRIAYPIRGLCLRIAPMLCGDEIYVGVFLSSYEELRHADVIAAGFGISSRELQVLHELLDGNSVAEIGDALGLAESTVNDHISRMVGKTNARNRTEMIAILLGWPAMKAKLTTNGASSDEQTDGSSNANGNGRAARRLRVGSPP